MSDSENTFLVRDYTRPPQEDGAVAVQDRPSSRPDEAPAKTPPKHLPMWKVLLHNDDVNTVDHVIATIVMLTSLNMQDAVERTVEAHNTGVSLITVVHQERAELYVEQFASRGLLVTIEPDED